MAEILGEELEMEMGNASVVLDVTGDVHSVNGKKGDVTLSADELGAYPAQKGAELAAKTEVLSARLDNAISAVTTDTEVTDVRVGADGKTYATAGSAVRGQCAALRADVLRLARAISGAASPVLASDWETGGINTATGEEINNVTKVIRTKTFLFSGRIRFTGESADGSDVRVCYVYCYDAAGVFLGRVYLIGTQREGRPTIENTAFIRFTYGFKTSSANTVADYGLENLAADFSAELMGGDDYAPKQESSALGAIAAVAETYLNEAYSADNQIVYQSGCGIFTEPLNADGLKATVCSQFFKTLITGTTYAASRYVQAENESAPWGYEYDSSTDAVFTAGTKGFLKSDEIARYCAGKGWLVPFDAEHNNIRPGDVLFWTSEDHPSNFETIHHVAICLQLFDGGCYIIHAGGNRARPVDGKDVGIEVRQISWADHNPKFELSHYARMPLSEGGHVTQLLLQDSETHTGTYSGASASTAVYAFEGLPLGFYTVQWEDAGDGAPYLKLNPDGVNANIKAFRQGERCGCVFYAAEPITKLNVRSGGGTAFSVGSVRLWRGCHAL